MQNSEDNFIVLDGENAFPDWGNPEWIADLVKKAKAAGVKFPDEAEQEPSELSARARKKKRIYKRKKSDPKPSA
jgi:hypothetical protein